MIINREPKRQLAILVVLLVVQLLTATSKVKAQAPTPDSYEENDSLVEAAAIPVGSELGNLTISPASDPDWFRTLLKPSYAYPSTIRVEVIATPGLDLTLTAYGPDAQPLVSFNDPNGPNAAITLTVPVEGYYAFEVSDTTGSEGWYLLRVVDRTPAPTATPTVTGTLMPTATSPYPTDTPTPELGGPPDVAEPNYDFAHAYRIVPGDVLDNLNFNSGVAGQVDNDFFVMAVRARISYTCETRDLGPSVDTNLIIYGSASFDDLVGGNDDVDTQAGQINSRLTFSAPREGDIYLLAGYKYPQTEDIPFPGAATYTLSCVAAAPTPTPEPVWSGGPVNLTPQATPLSIELVASPDVQPTATPEPVIPQTVDVLVGYDRNDNGSMEPNEGVQGISVRVVQAASNRELSHGLTDSSGTVRFTLASTGPVRVIIPFLGAAQDFRPGSPAQWQLLIPAAHAPGLIP